jgi:hypothetical protein
MAVPVCKASIDSTSIQAAREAYDYSSRSERLAPPGTANRTERSVLFRFMIYFDEVPLAELSNDAED